MKKLLLLLSITAISVSTQAQTIANGTMESWESLGTSLSLQRPTSWWGLDKTVKDLETVITLAGYPIEAKKQVFKSEDAYEGDFAARILSRKISDTYGVLPGILSNSEVGINLAAVVSILASGSLTDITDALMFTGGTPLLGKKVDSVTFYALFPYTNIEDGGVSITAFKKITEGGVDTLMPIGTGMAMITTDSFYQRYSVPMVYTDGDHTSTDTLRIIFTSSISTDTVFAFTDENRLFVDKVELYSSEGTWLGINDMKKTDLGFALYPNPANNYLSINNQQQLQNCLLQIVDINGRIMHQEKLKNDQNQINITKYASGIYYYQIANEDQSLQQIGNFVKQ